MYGPVYSLNHERAIHEWHRVIHENEDRTRPRAELRESFGVLHGQAGQVQVGDGSLHGRGRLGPGDDGGLAHAGRVLAAHGVLHDCDDLLEEADGVEGIGVRFAALLERALHRQEVLGPLPVELFALCVALAREAHEQDVGHP